MIREIYLLVGGEATRLRPLSEGIPKALLTIKGRLLIDLILENLEESNLDYINLICSIKHESYWLNYQKNSKYKVNLHFEHEKLDTGGYVIQNLENFDMLHQYPAMSFLQASILQIRSRTTHSRRWFLLA